jgi:hypothetical protein
MDRRQQLFERGERGKRPGVLLLGGGIDDDGWRIDNGRRSGLFERLHLPSQFCDGLFEIGIVPREGQRRAVLHERILEFALPAQCIREAAESRQVLGCRPQHLLELLLRVAVVTKFEQCAAECDPRREIRRMYKESGAAYVDRFLEHARAAVLLRELSKRNRRRVLLDPSSEIFKA